MSFEVGAAAFSLAKDWLPRLLTALGSRRSEREDEINQIADIFGDPMQLAECYIEPDCQQFNPADDDEDEVRSIVKESIFKRLEHFFGGRLLTGGHQLFILADSGMGKSSVLMMLKLAHLKSLWPKEYDCVLVKLGQETIKRLDEIKGKRKTILLLDALDEDPTSWGRINARLKEILIASRNFWRVIISCRTQFFSAGEDPFNRRGKVEVEGFLCPVIYLSLFSDEQVTVYLKRRFSGRDHEIAEARALLSRMHSLRFRPMLLAHIEDLLQSETRDWTEYSIYEALVAAWLHRECVKPLPGRRMPRPEDVWTVCSQLALHLHDQGSREIAETALIKLLGDGFRHLSRLDIGGRSLLNKNSQGAYRFSHYSIQEFLVARELALGRMVRPLASVRATDQLLRFLIAWLSKQGANARASLPFRCLNMRTANLNGADLHLVNLSGACLVDAHLDEANLKSANLSGTDFSRAYMKGADLSKAVCVRTKLENVQLAGGKLHATNLRNASLAQADLGGADLLGATFVGANLAGANFKGAALRGANLRNARLENADLRVVDSLKDTNLKGASFNKQTIWPAGFNYQSATGRDANGIEASPRAR
jgi:uncharacterized protein YjbI with pentapeptide repeats